MPRVTGGATLRPLPSPPAPQRAFSGVQALQCVLFVYPEPRSSPPACPQGSGGGVTQLRTAHNLPGLPSPPHSERGVWCCLHSSWARVQLPVLEWPLGGLVGRAAQTRSGARPPLPTPVPRVPPAHGGLGTPRDTTCPPHAPGASLLVGRPCPGHSGPLPDHLLAPSLGGDPPRADLHVFPA